MTCLVRTALFTLSVAVLAGCGGGSGAPAASPVTPPAATPAPVVPPPPVAFTIVSSDPADGASATPRAGSYLATLSAAPEAASVTAASVQLVGPLGNVLPVELSVTGSEVRLTPQAPALPGGTRYTVNFAATIKDKDGRALAAPSSRSFTTAPQNWSTVSQLAELADFTSGTVPVLAVDRAGTVTAVWRHQDRDTTTAFASRMNALTGTWSAPVVLHSADRMNSDFGGLAAQTDEQGNVYVVWQNYSTSARTAMMARYAAATSAWERPLLLDGLPAGLEPAAVVFAADGKGKLVVVTRSDFPAALYGASFDPVGGTWSTPQEIEKPASDNYIFNEQIVADGAGNVTVGWIESGSVNFGLKVSRYSAAGGKWSAPHRLDDNFTSQPLALAADASGGVTAAWQHGRMIMDVPYIAAARFEPVSGTWTAATRLSVEGDAFGARQPAVVTDAAGIASVVWQQSNSLFSARSGRATATWSAPVRIGNAVPGNTRSALTADAAGNVVLLYVESGMPTAVRYAATEGQWNAPVALGTPSGTTAVFANDPVSVIDASGNVTAAWIGQLAAAQTSRYVVAAASLR